MSNGRVIVFGTTADYIAMIDERYPGRCLFITDPLERARADQLAPDNRTEILCDLENLAEISSALDNFISVTGISISGIVAFDDESMRQASLLASRYELRYPSTETVEICRSKYRTKALWHKAGVPCPETALVGNPAEAINFIECLKQPVVIKPLTGSGSELTFYCEDKFDCMRAFVLTREHLIAHPNARMYRRAVHSGADIDPRDVYGIESYISGREYSCDFIVNGDDVEIIRIAKKIHAHDRSFGTTLAYIVPSSLPGSVSPDNLKKHLKQAACSVGIERSLCMIDFIVHNDSLYFLEIAPRPGGDCLPFLIRQSGGLDILGLTLDFSEGVPIDITAPHNWKRLVGLRLFAKHEGIIEKIDDTVLRSDARVREIYFKHRESHEVILPPDDYDSRILGHVIFEPTSHNIEKECHELSEKLLIYMEAPKWETAMGS